jgi:hypothetical protein
MVTTLYRVQSTVDNFEHRGLWYNGVQFVWHCNRARDEYPVPPEVALADYTPDDEYAASQLDELFTEEQAHQLAAYLKAQHDDDAEITPVELPIQPALMPDGSRKHYAGVSFLPLGGPDDIYMLYREPEYSLPFKVGGFYSVDELEPVEPKLDDPISAKAVRSAWIRWLTTATDDAIIRFHKQVIDLLESERNTDFTDVLPFGYGVINRLLLNDINDVRPGTEWVGMCQFCNAPIGAFDEKCAACGRDLAF